MGGTGVGWRNAIQIPAFAGMTAGGAGMTVGESVLWTLWAPAFAGDSEVRRGGGVGMDSGLRRNEGWGGTGVGWRNAIQIPAFAGMTAGGGNDGWGERPVDAVGPRLRGGFGG